MIPPKVARIELSQIASPQQDAVIFDVNSVQTLADAQEVFLIFYLSKDDELNGYGTVIQLDPQTKQATIYSDLNPEYTYLFFKNDQNQIQSLLWCIEVATRTNDGLFIAHAKSYGRGITEEDLQRVSAGELDQAQPEPVRQLAEEYTPQPAPTTASASTPVAPQPPIQPATTTPELAPPMQTAQPATNPASSTAPKMQSQTEALQSSFTAPQATPPTPQPTVEQTQPIHDPAQVPVNSAEVPFQEPPQTPVSSFDELQLQPQSTPAQPSEPAVTAEDQLPPLPTSSVQAPTEALPTEEPLPNPTMSVTPTATPEMDIPDIFSSTNQAYNADAQNPTPKQPVGRPQKQLIADQLWPVSQQDFTWAKNMSRSAMSEIKNELWEKVIYQIRLNQPGLIEDWEFHGAFETAFHALCTSYDLLPALRHDILKSLLNGRVVESIKRQKPPHQH